MDASSLYTSMAGLQDLSAQIQATAANLANTQTPGYAAVQAAAVAAPYAGTNAPAGADVVAQTPGPDTSAGPVEHTGDPLNVAVHGDAWLEVQTANGNALTRDGNLQITSAGILANSAGDPIMGAGGSPISVPNLAKLEIGTDGTVSGVPAATPGAPAQAIGKIRMVSTPAGGLTDIGNSLFTAAPGVTLQTDATASLAQNYLNGSNVDQTQSMMTMIANSRSYQLQTELMKNQAAGGGSLNTLLSQG
jgi:flagellar basal-body rod protein FlgF